MSNNQTTHTPYEYEYFAIPRAEHANMRKWVLNHIHDVLQDYSYDESCLYNNLIVQYSAILGDVSGYELSISNDWWIESFDDIGEMIDNVMQEDEDIEVIQLGTARCYSGPRMFVMFRRRFAQYTNTDAVRAMMLHGIIPTAQ